MNTTPMLRGQPIRNDAAARTCNEENRAVAFWQSRMTKAGHRAEPIQPTDVRALAIKVRKGWK